jgi:hypothetical protein
MGPAKPAKIGFFSAAIGHHAPAGNDMVTALIALKHCPSRLEMPCKPAIEKPR